MNATKDVNEQLLPTPNSNDLLAAFEEEAAATDDEGEKENEYLRILKIAAPSIICQFCLMTPNCINIWAVGNFDNTILTDVVGLGMGVVNSFGMAIFIGLNSALYTFFA